MQGMTATIKANNANLKLMGAQHETINRCVKNFQIVAGRMAINEVVFALLSKTLSGETATALSDTRVVAFVLSVIASLGTFLGGLVTLFLVRVIGIGGDGTSGTSGTLVGVLQAFSAGVMLYMTFMDLVPEASAEIGSRETMLYFFVGVGIFGLLEAVFLDDSHSHADTHDNLHDHILEKSSSQPPKKSKKSRSRSPSKTKQTIKADKHETVDITSEKGKKQLLRTKGLGVYLSALSDARLGLQLAIAICLHNIPLMQEGMAVAIPLYAAGGSSFYVLGMTFANGLGEATFMHQMTSIQLKRTTKTAEPIGVIIGVAFFGSYLTPSVLSRSLAVVGGIMCCISIHELQPTAIRYAGQSRASASLFAGMFVVFCALEAVTEYFGHPHSHSEIDHSHLHNRNSNHHHQHIASDSIVNKVPKERAVEKESNIVWSGDGDSSSDLKSEKFPTAKFVRKGSLAGEDGTNSHVPSIVKAASSRIPPLNDPAVSAALRKGQSGRILVVGGSEEYSGAPFYAGIAALRTGADICHIACHPLSSAAIKTYSADLIVHPLIDPTIPIDQIILDVIDILKRVHVIIVGPGLSRNAFMQEVATRIIEHARELGLYIVLDADGLFLVQEKPSVISGYRKAVLTPNSGEFMRLCDKMNIPFSPLAKKEEEAVLALSKSLGKVTVILKGHNDVISDGQLCVSISETGSPRRCGGQGDLLSGVIATFLGWMKGFQEGLYSRDGKVRHENAITIDLQSDSAVESVDVSSEILACASGSVLLKRTSRRAFDMKGRSMTATVMADTLGQVFSEVFDEADFKKRN
ncbi:hypothetical protein HK100_000496 [Physocladia obscura]|uniref:ATP-dependent (S)-NAD(P)H-hydrate dehydratase n=1 Tax=Physocladia obscura TaxID=109957 RepID=A0AAD5XGI6_9FUNG|nr:hypothetical protein HK100_000496 [Physocladia obscura]